MTRRLKDRTEVAALGPLSDHGGLAGLAGKQRPAGPVGLAVMPGRLHQQPAGVGVARCPPLDCSVGTRPLGNGPVQPVRIAPVGLDPVSRKPQATTVSQVGASRSERISPVTPSITPATIERACTSKPTHARSKTIRRLP